jgi:DNA polymerase-3 subunit gamma/tau
MITGAIAGEGSRRLLNVSDEVYEELTRECKMATQEELIRYIRVLSELSSQLKYSTQKRVITDICFIKLTNPQMDAEEGLDNLSVRLEAVEKKLDNPDLFKGGEKEVVYVSAPVTEETKPLTESQKKEYLAALPEDIQGILKRWNEVCKAAGVVAASYLSDIKPMEEDGKLKLGFTKNMGYKYFIGEDGKHREELEKILSDLSGKAVEVVIADYSEDEGDMRIPDLSEIIDFDIEFK